MNNDVAIHQKVMMIKGVVTIVKLAEQVKFNPTRKKFSSRTV